MDIRAYFSSTRKPNTTPKQDTVKNRSTPASSAKKTRKRIIESDSDDNEELVSDKRKKKKSTESTVKSKRKRIIDSSDDSDHENVTSKVKPSRKKDKVDAKKPSAEILISDSSAEEVSPVKEPQLRNRKSSPSKIKLKAQNKLENLTVKSKFFKEATAQDIFGNEPVKRVNKKLQDIKERLESFRSKNPKEEPKIEDEDAAFEAVLDQLDEVGDNWIKIAKTEEVKSSEKFEKKAEEFNKTEKKVEKPSRSKHTKEDKNQLMKKAMSCTVDIKKISDEFNHEGPADSLSSGYGSADSQFLIESSDSQNSVNSNITPLKCNLISKKKKEDTFDKESQLDDKKSVKTSCNKIEADTSQLADTTVSSSKELPPSVIEDQLLWVEKWKPQSSKKIIGQQGERSNVNKLVAWLNNWYENNTGSKKAVFVPSGWNNKDPTGACFKAALLSGPPGVGKTTSVTLVCRELGFDMVEFNASDTRSKKLLQEEVSELLKCTSLTPFFVKEGSQSASVTKKHVLVMDEVDGMAGNEDRGGVQELIQLIKSTKVPIICMCNDRNHPKIRSLSNYCFDLRFSRPRVEQIKGYMRTVCFKEKLNVSADTLTDIITSANNDVRLVLNHLSMLAADKNSSLDATTKYVKLGAWDVLRKVFSKEEHKKMSIHDKCDLFFYDYSIAPLFVQENYLMVKPLNDAAKDKCKMMELFARAADCISMGDMVDLQIRSNSAWSLLPTQAIFASYAPGEILEGYCSAQINFPAWLGKYSKTARNDRLLQEIQVHTRLKVSASKNSVNLDYAPHLMNRILDPLMKNGTEGVQAALSMLHDYDLLKEDVESLQEICQWPNSVHKISSLDSKVKAAFTRAYNKNSPMRPYSLTAPMKKGSGNTPEDIVEENEIEDENEKSDDEADAMIITKKRQPTKTNEKPVAFNSKKKNNTRGNSKRNRKK